MQAVQEGQLHWGSDIVGSLSHLQTTATGGDGSDGVPGFSASPGIRQGEQAAYSHAEQKQTCEEPLHDHLCPLLLMANS